MKSAHCLLAACLMLTGTRAFAQTTVVVKEGALRGRVTAVNPITHVMTVSAAPGRRPVVFYGVERARIQRARGQVVSVAEVQPGTDVAVFYTAQNGYAYPTRIILPDLNLAVPAVPLTAAEEKALDSKAANDGDITTNPGVKARIDRDITTQPGRKDPTDSDITKQAK